VKALTLIFVILIALLQYPLWLGKGSWLRVWDLSRQLATQQEKNSALKARNETLDAEVRDLKSGRAAIEERARSELGMIKQDEVFYQVLDNSAHTQSVQPPSQPSNTGQVSSQTATPSQTGSKDTVMQRTTSAKALQ
jgi:cell division protein FtsB